MLQTSKSIDVCCSVLYDFFVIFSDFQWHDFGFLAKINYQDVGKEWKNSKILAGNSK